MPPPGRGSRIIWLAAPTVNAFGSTSTRRKLSGTSDKPIANMMNASDRGRNNCVIRPIPACYPRRSVVVSANCVRAGSVGRNRASTMAAVARQGVCVPP